MKDMRTIKGLKRCKEGNYQIIKSQNEMQETWEGSYQETPSAEINFCSSLALDLERLKSILRDDHMVIYRDIQFGPNGFYRGCLIYVDGMINTDTLHENVIQPILQFNWQQPLYGNELLAALTKQVLVAGSIKTENQMPNAIKDLLCGYALMLIDGVSQAILIDVKGWETRSISQPETERVVRGPREGFIENLLTNLTMIRRKVTNPDLKFIYREIGTRTKTKICICYLEGVARKEIIAEVFRRIDKVQIDGILEAEYIVELIRDAPLSPFETIGTTEKPDTAVGKLLEGRVIILVDGSPFALTLPFLFIEYFQANKDYYDNFWYSSINRIIRIIGFFLATSTPALFVAIVNYHQEMIPTALLLSISFAKEGVPFPTVVEAFAMLFAFQILREAGVRLPSTIGQAVSIVGALVLGEAAVTAKIVGAPMVIVIALTGISSFLIPEMPGVVLILSIIFLSASSLLGLFGYIFMLIGLLIYLMSLRSFGVDYMSNITSLNAQELKDMGVRAPWFYMKLRPKLLSRDKKRLFLGPTEQ